MRPSNLPWILPSLWALLATWALALPAVATETFVLSSGIPGGHYHDVAKRVVTLLSQEGLRAANLTSAGSVDNLTLLADPESSVNVTLVQADALRFYLDENPAFADELVVLDDLGEECVVLVTKAKGGIESAADLKGGGPSRLVLPGAGSGAAVTFEYMRRMEPAYREREIEHREPMEAMLQMRMSSGSDVAALMLVKRPRAITPEMEIVLENPDQFRIAPVRPADVKNGKLPDGSPVYRFAKVTTGFGSDFRVSFDTLCTRALMITSKSKLTEPSRRELSRILLKFGRLIAPFR